MDCPTRSLEKQASYAREPNAPSSVGTVPHVLTAEEREAAIKRSGELIVHYMNLWEKTSDFQYRGDADRARRLQNLLIEARSPEQPARMRAD
jgi:hypothetical protein